MKNIFLILISCGFFSAFAQIPAFQWAKSIGGPFHDVSKALCVDGSGNVYTAGSFSGTADTDPGPGLNFFMSQGNRDICILKLDQNGNFVWAKQVGGINGEYCYAVKTDASGNLYLTGEFAGTVDFDPGPGTFTLATVSPVINAFILKLDASGNFVWAKQIGDGIQYGSSGWGIWVDVAGDVLAVGRFSGTMDFDPGIGVFNLTTGTANTAYVLKLGANGNFTWAVKLGGSSSVPNTYSDAMSVKTDPNGNVYIGGSFSQTGDFDPGFPVFNLVSSGLSDGYISKLDANGNFIWVRQFAGVGDYAVIGLALDCLGNIYSTGDLVGGVFDADPGPGTVPLTGIGSADIFVSKLDAAGNYVWGKQIGNSGPNSSGGTYSAATQPYGLDVDRVGDVYLTGIYSHSVDFDPGPGTYTLSPFGGFNNWGDIFLAKLNSAGNFAWAFGAGTVGPGEFGYAITTDASFNVYATGIFSLTPDFDPSAGVANLYSAGGLDNFILKLSQATPTVPIPVPTPLSLTLCAGLSALFTATGSGALAWFASPTSSNALASGSVYTTPPLNNTTVYYVENQVCGLNSSRPSVTVNINPAPSLTLATNNTVVCIGTVPTVTVSGAQSYIWNNTATTAVITFTPTGPSSSFTVLGTTNSCTAAASIIFSVVPVPSLSLATTGLMLCKGSSRSMTVSGAQSYAWSTAATNSIITVMPTAAMLSYSVTGTSSNSCTATASITFSIFLCIGIESQFTETKDRFVIYPNPGTGAFNILTVDDIILKISNETGQIIKTISVKTGEPSLSLNDLSAGIYFVSVVDSDVRPQKIIILRQ